MGGKKKHDLSASDFRDELLLTLADLSFGDPANPVKFDTTYEPICTMKGSTLADFLAEYGERDTDGKPWIKLWISGAFNWLKSQGLADSAGRGKWTITVDGLNKARALGAPATTSQILAPVDDDSKAASDVVLDGVSLSVGPTSQEATYHPDPYIRIVATQSTRCFGHYTPRQGGVCDDCPLAGPCRNLQATDLTALAAQLHREDEEEAKRLEEEAKRQKTIAEAAKKAALDKSGTTPSASTVPKPASGWDNTGVKQIICYMNATCYRCGQDIAKDEECCWKKDESGATNGLFHQHCK